MTRKPPENSGVRTRFFYGYTIVACAFFINIALWSAFWAFGVFFKPVLNEFGWTRATTSGAFSLCFILSGLLGIPMGELTDRLGTRLVMTISGILVGVGYLLMAQIDSLWQLYAFYGIIIGVGMGGDFVPLVSTVVRWFIVRRGIMSGIVLVGTSTGALIGPLIAERLISAFDWRISYIILGTVVLVAVTTIAQFLRRDPSQMGQKPYGSESNTSDIQSLESQSTGLSLFDAFHTTQFWLLFIALFCSAYGTFVFVVHIAAHVTDLGFSATIAAITLSAFGAGSLIGRIVMGGATDRIGGKTVILICLIMSVVSTFVLVSANQMWILIPTALILGCAHGGVGASEASLIAEIFGLKSHGLILGVLGFGYTMGASISPVVAGHLYDLSESYQTAFLMSSIIAFAGVILTIFLKPGMAKKRSQQTPSSIHISGT